MWFCVRLSPNAEIWSFLRGENVWKWAITSNFWIVRQCENERKRLKRPLFHVWDCMKLSPNAEKGSFLRHETVQEWAETRKKLDYSGYEIVWDWAKKLKNSRFSGVRMCEFEPRCWKIAVSQAWDCVRMSADDHIPRFLTVLPPPRFTYYYWKVVILFNFWTIHQQYVTIQF